MEGLILSFPLINLDQISRLEQFEQHENIRNRLWSLDYGTDLDQDANNRQSSVNLILKSSDKDSRVWPRRYLSLGPSSNACLLSEAYTFVLQIRAEA